MAAGTKSVIYTAIPVALISAAAGLIVKKSLKRDGHIPEQIKEATDDAIKEIDSTMSELKGNLEGKSISHLEKNLDTTIENAKVKLDRMASQMKQKLHSYQAHAEAENAEK